MKDIVFLILHYKNYELTKKCVDSILELEDSNNLLKKIVIVDNFSNNKTMERLEKNYGNKIIKYLYLKENVGFSLGNNEGFNYIKSNLNPKILVVCNNDIIFTQKDFIKVAENILKENQYDVLGPDIYCPSISAHQNPRLMGEITVERIEKEIQNYENKILKLDTLSGKIAFSLKFPLKKIRNRLGLKYLKNQENDLFNKNHMESKDDVCLMASCYILNDTIIKNLEELFYPNIFLGAAEHTFYYRCKKMGYVCRYEPELSVNHLHDYLKIGKFNETYNKERFMYINNVKSRKQYLNLITESDLKLKKKEAK